MGDRIDALIYDEEWKKFNDNLRRYAYTHQPEDELFVTTTSDSATTYSTRPYLEWASSTSSSGRISAEEIIREACKFVEECKTPYQAWVLQEEDIPYVRRRRTKDAALELSYEEAMMFSEVRDDVC